MSFDTDVFTSPAQSSGFDQDVFKASGTGVATIPGTPAQPVPKEYSLIEKIKGIGESGRYLANALVSSPLAIPLAVVSEAGGNNKAGQFARYVLDKLITQPKSDAGKEYASNINSALQQTIPLSGLTAEMNAMSILSGPAASQLAEKVRPKIDPEVASLAKKADAMGIPLRPDMLYENKLAKMVGSMAEQDIPLAFSKESKRTDAINRATLQIIDPESKATKVTPETYVSALNKQGERISSIAADVTLPVTKELKNSLSSVVDNASVYGADTATLIKARRRDFLSLGDGNQIPGSEFQTWNSRMLGDIRKSTGHTQDALISLQRTAMDAFEAQLSPEQLPLWKDARTRYAQGLKLMPAAAKSAQAAGDISPVDLAAAAISGREGTKRVAYGNAGDLGDLSAIANRFIKEPRISSIPERTLGYGVIGGTLAHGIMNPNPASLGIGAGLWGTSSLYNLLGPSIARGLVNRTDGSIAGMYVPLGMMAGPGLFGPQLEDRGQ